jgi:hypothetical protein
MMEGHCPSEIRLSDEASAGGRHKTQFDHNYEICHRCALHETQGRAGVCRALESRRRNQYQGATESRSTNISGFLAPIRVEILEVHEPIILPPGFGLR